VTLAIVVVSALLLAPGVGAALGLAPPGAISIESRIALAFGLGYALVAGLATVLVLAHAFYRPVFIAGVVLATAAVWAVALRRASLRAHASAFAAQAREAPFALAGGLALLLAVAATRPFFSPERTLVIRSGWRYWADGLEVAGTGQVPAQTMQWGTEFPSTVSKLVLNSFDGGVTFLLGAGPLSPLHGIVFVSAVGFAAALLALGRELGLGVFAPLVPALTMLVPDRLPLSHEIATDLKWFTAEDVGRMAAFSFLIVGIYAIRASDRWFLAALTGVLLAMAALTHAVPALVAGVMLSFYALATWIRARMAWRRAALSGAILVGACGFCYVAILGLSGGDLGFQRAEGATFKGFPPNVDPTRSFSHGSFVTVPPKKGHFLVPPRGILRRYGEQLVDNDGGGRVGVALLAALALGSIIMVLRARSLIPLAAVVWGLVGTTLALSLFFSYRYDTLVPGDFGPRRLNDYVALVPALLVPGFLQVLTRPLAGRRAAVAVLAFTAAALAVAAAIARIPQTSVVRGHAGVAVIKRVADVVPCNTRMLSNARTAGTWEAWTGRRAVTEGHAPFLRPGVLERILPVLIGANRFWNDPQANRDFLSRQRIQYLVAVKPNIWVGTNGERRPGPNDAEAVAALPDVHQIFRDKRVAVFAVGPRAPSAVGGQPSRCPV
jgi:hypothetical protein